MSTDNPIDLRQDRREWLKTSAAALGASLLPLPAVPAETPQAEPAPAAPPAQAASESKSAARFFTPTQHALVDELSECLQRWIKRPNCGAVDIRGRSVQSRVIQSPEQLTRDGDICAQLAQDISRAHAGLVLGH